VINAGIVVRWTNFHDAAKCSGKAKDEVTGAKNFEKSSAMRLPKKKGMQLTSGVSKNPVGHRSEISAV